ncbi:MAG: hypothetical protein M3Q45_06840 [Chloroflexota bacterium]|nr:hypothetical protein [Chloroflexota bacterium]
MTRHHVARRTTAVLAQGRQAQRSQRLPTPDAQWLEKVETVYTSFFGKGQTVLGRRAVANSLPPSPAPGGDMTALQGYFTPNGAVIGFFLTTFLV